MANPKRKQENSVITQLNTMQRVTPHTTFFPLRETDTDKQAVEKYNNNNNTHTGKKFMQHKLGSKYTGKFFSTSLTVQLFQEV